MCMTYWLLMQKHGVFRTSCSERDKKTTHCKRGQIYNCYYIYVHIYIYIYTVVCKSGMYLCFWSCVCSIQYVFIRCHAVISHVNVYSCTVNCFNQYCRSVPPLGWMFKYPTVTQQKQQEQYLRESPQHEDKNCSDAPEWRHSGFSRAIRVQSACMTVKFINPWALIKIGPFKVDLWARLFFKGE